MFIVLSNTPGYMPEDDDPFTTDDYAEAVRVMREDIDRYCEDIAECEATATVEEGIASANNYAAVIVYRSDRIHDLGRVFSVELCEDGE